MSALLARLLRGSPLLFLYTTMAAQSGPDWDLLSSYVGLLTLATASVYIGSHGSVVVSLVFLVLWLVG